MHRLRLTNNVCTEADAKSSVDIEVHFSITKIGDFTGHRSRSARQKLSK